MELMPPLTNNPGDINQAVLTIERSLDAIARALAGQNNIGWWQELGRSTLSSAGDVITISFTAKKYLRIYYRLLNSGAIVPVLRFNNDSGGNYVYRYSFNGAADTTATSATSFFIDGSVSYNEAGYFDVFNNAAANEKPVYALLNAENSAGPTNIPGRGYLAGKWTNTSSQINRVDIINGGAGGFAIGSEIVVLGHD
jgi:hypothetical protein